MTHAVTHAVPPSAVAALPPERETVALIADAYVGGASEKELRRMLERRGFSSWTARRLLGAGATVARATLARRAPLELGADRAREVADALRSAA